MIRLKVEMVDCMDRICWDGTGVQDIWAQETGYVCGHGICMWAWDMYVGMGYVCGHGICMWAWDMYVGIGYVNTRYVSIGIY
jgi:hypothetical protein